LRKNNQITGNFRTYLAIKDLLRSRGKPLAKISHRLFLTVSMALTHPFERAVKMELLDQNPTPISIKDNWPLTPTIPSVTNNIESASYQEKRTKTKQQAQLQQQKETRER
jgi:hypothetical protein